MIRSLLRFASLYAAVAATAAVRAAPTELLVNGGFETGDLRGWTSIVRGDGAFSVVSDPRTPINFYDTVGPASGTYYAVSDQSDDGVRGLVQNFTVGYGTRAVLSFDMFVNDQDGGPLIGDGTLDASGDPKQFARVDLLVGSAGDFDTAGGVLETFYLGIDPRTSNPNPYTSYRFDISRHVRAGGTFRIRFAEVDNQLFLNQGVDNVSVQANAVLGPAAALPFALLVLRRRRA